MTQNQIAYFKAREDRRHNKEQERYNTASLAEMTRHNKSNETIDVYKAQLDARNKRYSSNMSYASSIYSADKHLEGTKYSADSSRAAAKYSADRSYASSIYATDKNYASSIYAIDQNNALKARMAVLQESNKYQMNRENNAMKWITTRDTNRTTMAKSALDNTFKVGVELIDEIGDIGGDVVKGLFGTISSLTNLGKLKGM